MFFDEWYVFINVDSKFRMSGMRHLDYIKPYPFGSDDRCIMLVAINDNRVPRLG